MNKTLRNIMILGVIFILFITSMVLLYKSIKVVPSDLATPVPEVSVPTDDFVITVKTDNPGTTTNSQFTIPTYSGETYNFNVDCDDDNPGKNTAAAQTGNYTCTYASAGTYTIRIKDNSGTGTGFPRIYFNDGGDKEKLLTIEQWGTGKWISMENAFYGSSNLTGGASDAPDLSLVMDMSYMFAFASAFNDEISSWETSNVTRMDYMFYNASAFNQDIGGWNIEALTSANGMFNNAALSTEKYDALLNGWDAGTLQTGILFSGGNSTYCAGETARGHMIGSDGWVITDGGKECSTPMPMQPNSDITDTSPKYTWTKVAEATDYQFQLYQGASLIYEKYATSTACGISSCNRTPIEILSYGDYQWRVRSKVGDIWSSYSPYEDFTVNFVPVPLKPSGEISATTPKFNWTKVVDAAYYQFQLYQGETLIYEKYATADSCHISSCSWTPSELLGNYDYQWRIRSKVGDIWSAYSSYKTFTVNP